MKQSRQIQIALLASILSIALCVTVLVGTTLAWFVDTSASTGNTVAVGQINAGFSLQREGESPVHLDPTQPGTVTALKTTKWAPGTEETVTFQVESIDPSLPFTYSIWLKSDTPVAKLATYLDVYINGSTESAGTVAKLINTPVVVETWGDNTQTTPQTITLTIRMKAAPISLMEDTDLLNLWFEVRADQQRDMVSQADNLQEQMEAGGYVQLGTDLTLVPTAPEGVKEDLVSQIAVTQDTMLDLSGKKLGVSVEEGVSLPYTPVLLSVENNSTLTIDGENGCISAEAGTNNSYGIDVKGGTLIINGGTYLGSMTAVQVEEGMVVINGGFFDLAPTCKAQVPDFAKYLINCIDESYKEQKASVEIRGGTFVNFDPSSNPEGEGTSYVADGYKVVAEEKATNEIWYTVVPEDADTSNG